VRGRARRVGWALAVSPVLVRNALARPRFGDAAGVPLISVVIATYNWSSVLRFAIASALGQTYPRVEVVVVGDGCTDDSEDVVASFADERVRWLNLPQNSGSQSIPNNAGIELARGDYIAYLGHDDLWLPTHLALTAQALLREDADLAHSITELVGPPGSKYRALVGHGNGSAAAYARGDVIPPSSIVHRRSLVDESGPWRDYRTIQLPPDVDFVSRAYDHGKRFVCVNALTVFKFSSAYRRNSYVEKPWHEQATYAHRIETEPGFVYRELAALTAALPRRLFGAAKRLPAMPEPPDPLPLGWHVTQYRRIRGLEADGDPAGNAGGPGASSST